MGSVSSFRDRFTAIASIVAASLLAACGNAHDRYTTAPVEVGDIRDVIPAQGRLVARREIAVTPLSSGRVAEIYVDANETVAAGQPLLRLDVESMDLDAQEIAAEVAGAEAALEVAVARASESARVLSSRRQLSERGFYSQAAVAAAQSQLSVDEAAISQARAALGAARTRAERVGRATRSLVVRAPITGVVLARNVEIGQWVESGTSESMFQLSDSLSRLRLTAWVAEPDVGRLSEDLTVIFRVDAFPTEQFEGAIAHIAQRPEIDGAFVSYPVFVDVQNDSGRLRPGMTTATEFVRTDLRRVVRVPLAALYFVPHDYAYDPPEQLMADLASRGLTSARSRNAAEMGVLFAGGKRRLFVRRGGSWERREVRIGGQSREFVEVIEGVTPGEHVIIADNKPADQIA